MTIDIGRYGVFRGAGLVDGAFAAELERLGYGALWLGGSPDAGLAVVDELLGATSALVVGTGIVNVWKDAPEPVAASFERIEGLAPGRFLLGLGIGHPEATAGYHSPYATLVAYLDRLAELGVPSDRIVLAALGPRVLRLAAGRTAGALPYLVTPEHTRLARELLGAGALLAPEQKVVLADVAAPTAETRAVGRPSVERPYLSLVNYRNNLLRLGFTEDDLAGGGSDALIDALVAQGTAGALAARLDEHLAAGADQVVVQPLGSDPLGTLTAVAGALGLTSITS